MEEKATNATRFDSIAITREGEQDKRQELVKRLSKFPRTYYLFVYVIFPLLFLIAICFLCGFFLAVLEKEAEIRSNDAYLQKIFMQELIEGGMETSKMNFILTATSDCIKLYSLDKSNSCNITACLYDESEMDAFMTACMESATANRRNPAQEILDNAEEESPESLTFHWMRCPLDDDKKEGLSQMQYSSHSVIESFNATFQKKRQEYKHSNVNGNSFKEFEDDVQKMSGHRHCNLHTAGGALFWFTVMTTIGYGNAVPQSETGHTLIYTLGFISILLFAAVNAKAAYVSLEIVDDFFRNHHLKPLTKGAGASIFWLVAYYSWNCVIAFMVMNWSKLRSVDRTQFKFFYDSYWFAYITTTTVGFGDYHLPHEVAYDLDIIYTPFVVLIGFVFLSNFLIKFGDWIGIAIEKHNLFLSTPDLHILLEEQSKLERVASERRIARKRSSRMKAGSQTDVSS